MFRIVGLNFVGIVRDNWKKKYIDLSIGSQKKKKKKIEGFNKQTVVKCRPRLCIFKGIFHSVFFFYLALLNYKSWQITDKIL